MVFCKVTHDLDNHLAEQDKQQAREDAIEALGGPIHRWHRACYFAFAVCTLLDQGNARLGAGGSR